MNRPASTASGSSLRRGARRLPYRLRRGVARHPYVLTCSVITILFLGIAYAVSAHIGVPVRDPEGALLGKRMMGPVLLMGGFAMFDAVRRAWRMRRAGSRERLAALSVRVFVDRWWWQRLLVATIGFLCFAFTYLAYRNLKSFVSLINYRSYDPELLAMDRWFAFGHDPSRVLHHLLGTGWIASLLSSVYLTFIPLVAITVALALALEERMREAYVYVAAMMWCWILGTVSYYAIPTLGPFASKPSLFDPLPSTSVSKLQNALENQRISLHADNLGENVVGGIAGFASLHVGIVVCCLLMMRYYGHRALMWSSAVFLIPTTIATIYFGWHFIIDDIAGSFIGWLSVLLARATVYPRIMLVWRRRGAGDTPSIDRSDATARA